MRKYFTLLYTMLLSLGGYAQAQFCIPSYTTGPTVGDSIVSFQLGSINASFPGDPSGYNDYTTLAGATTSLTAGQVYTASIVNNPTFGENVALFIDFNNDTTFDVATEKLGEVNILAGQTGTITFTVPPGAMQTTVRLRMVCDFNAGPVDPCLPNATWGETEDYHVTILPPSDDDVGVTAIEQVANPGGPCTSLGMVPITVEVSNFGNLAQTSVPMAYSINGGVPVPEIFTPANLPMAGSVDTFTFTVLADLSAFNATYNIQVWTDLAADTLPQNDTLNYTVVTPNLPAVTPSNAYMEDFETFTPGFPGTLANGWTTTTTFTPRWTVTEGPGFDNNSSGTGPWFDNTLQGAVGGRYVFTESSGGTVGAIFDLVSPCIDLSGVTGPRLEFAYHMFGSPADMSFIVTQVLSNGVWTTVDSIGGPQQAAGTDPWLIRNVGLGAYAGQVIQIRFLGNNPSTGFQGDAALDDVKIFQPLPNDGGITDAFGIMSACGISNNETIQSIGRNFGTDTLFSVGVNYSINGVLGTAITINDTIAPDSTFTADFTGIDLSVPGTYDICVFTTNIAGDVNQLNDTTCFTVVNIPVLNTFPYFEDFESGNGGWTADGTNGTWALGTPAKAVINSAAGGVNSWVTGGLTGQYNNNDNSFILGPCFDFTTLVKPIIRLDVWWESEFSWDGMKVQTSIDAGATWQDVGMLNDPNNWYNDGTISGLSYTGTQVGWSGRFGTGSGGWVSAEHELNGLGGQSSVLVRVAFGSDGSVQGEGAAFDNVEIFEAPPFDLAANRLVSPVSGCGLTDSSQVKLEYIHEGSQSVTNVVFGYSIDGAAAVLETDTTTVNPGDTLCYLFTAIEDLSIPDTYDITVWVSAPGDTDNGDDTLAVQVLHKIPITTYPYLQTFDNPGGVDPPEWENVQGEGAQDWIMNSGGTFVFNSGPTADHTFGTPNGFYALASDQFNNNDDSVIYITPCFDVTALMSPKFSFWYHSNNANGPNDPFENELHIDLIFNGTIIYDFIPPIVHKDNNWNLIELNMDQYIGVFAFRFRANNNNGAQVHDFAIDDIGLVEVLPQDVGVTALIDPMDGCGLLATDTVIVEVTNIGTDSVKGGFDVNFQLNGGAISTISITDTILAGNVLQVPFFPVDLSTPGIYNVTSWTSGLAGDTNFGNDTLQADIISEPSVGIPLSEDFETYSLGDITFLDFFNDPNADINWQVRSGGTPSTGTGPTAAFSGTNYIYMETSGPAAGSEAILRSACIDLSGVANPSLFYAYHMFGSTIGSLSVDVETPAGTTNLNQIIGQVQTANGDPWMQDTLDLSPWAGQVIRVIFTGVTNGSFQSDISIDAIDIRELVDNDITALAMLQPASADCSSDSTVVEIQITNTGVLPQVNVPVTVDYTGAITGSISTTVPGPIAPGAVVNVVVGTVNTLAGGMINFTGYSSLTGDTTNVNDTTFSMTTITVRPPAPTAVMDTIVLCTPDSTVASVVNDTAYSYLWYTDPVGGSPIAFDTADFQTGFLSSDTTLYVEAVPGGDGALIKVTEAELLGPDYVEVMNTGLTPVDVTGWTVVLGEDGATDINTVNPAMIWTMNGVMQPGEIRVRNDAFGDPNYIGANILWNGGQEGWVVILDAQNTVVDVMFFNYSDTDIMGFAPTINGVTIDITGKWSGPGVDVTSPVFAQNCYRVGTFDNNDASDWMTDATAGFAGQGTLNPGLGPVVTGGGGGGACPSEPRTPITILVAPPVTLDLGPDAVTCAGFVVDAFDPSIASYTWNTGEMTSSITVNTTGTYYVDVIDNNGCVGTDTINLNILPSPMVEFGQDSLVSCGGVTLDAGNAGSSFLWSVAGQFQQTLQVTTTGTYWVEANLNGCIDSDTIYIEVLPAPSVSFGGTIAACDDVTLDAGNPGSTYAWSTGATSQTITVTPPTSGADTITVTVTNAEGCDVTEQVIITPGVDPVVDLGADVTDCDSVLLDAGNAGSTFAWSTGETTQTIYATTSGNYMVTVTDPTGCESSDDIDVTLEFTPVAAGSTPQDFGYTYDFTNQSTPGASVVWDFGDGSPTTTDPNPTHVYAFDGSYTVTLIATNNCGSDTTTITIGSVDIDELFSQSIDVFPNPTTGNFYIKSAELQADDMTIEVYDAKGSIIYRKQLGRVNGFDEQVDLTNHPEGVYMVKISDGTRHASKRIVRK